MAEQGVEPGAGGAMFVPYLLGERSPYVAPEASATDAAYSQMHNARHISRAVLEGVLMNLREILEVCVDAGLQTDQIIASRRRDEGAAVRALLADVLGREVVTRSPGPPRVAPTAPALGRRIRDRGVARPASALGQVQVEHAFTPDPPAQQRYEQVFAAHRRLHEALEDVSRFVAAADA